MEWEATTCRIRKRLGICRHTERLRRGCNRCPSARSSQSSCLLPSRPSHLSSWPEVNPHEMRRVKHPRVGVWDLYEEVNPLPRPAYTATRLVLARGIRSLRHNCASFTCCAPSKMCSRAEVAGYIWARTRPWWGSGTLASQSTRYVSRLDLICFRSAPKFALFLLYEAVPRPEA